MSVGPARRGKWGTSPTFPDAGSVAFDLSQTSEDGDGEAAVGNCSSPRRPKLYLLLLHWGHNHVTCFPNVYDCIASMRPVLRRLCAYCLCRNLYTVSHPSPHYFGNTGGGTIGPVSAPSEISNTAKDQVNGQQIHKTVKCYLL